MASASRLGGELTVRTKIFQLLFFRLSKRYDELVLLPYRITGTWRALILLA